MYRSSSDPVASFSPLAQLLSVELLKVAFSFAWWAHERKTASPGDQYTRLENGYDEGVSTPEPESRESGQHVLTSSPLRFSIPPYPTLVPLFGIAALSCAVGFSVRLSLTYFLPDYNFDVCRALRLKDSHPLRQSTFLVFLLPSSAQLFYGFCPENRFRLPHGTQCYFRCAFYNGPVQLSHLCIAIASRTRISAGSSS